MGGGGRRPEEEIYMTHAKGQNNYSTRKVATRTGIGIAVQVAGFLAVEYGFSLIADIGAVAFLLAFPFNAYHVPIALDRLVLLWQTRGYESK